METNAIIPGSPQADLIQLRVRIGAVIGARVLTPAAKQVMIALILDDPDNPVTAGKAPTQRLAEQLALTDRAVRGALRELRLKGWIGGKGGSPLPPGAERAFREASEADADNRLIRLKDRPGPDDHLDMLELIRDQALAQGQSAAALKAEGMIGRLCGHDKPPDDSMIPADPRARKVQRDEQFAAMAKRMARDFANDPSFQHRLHRLTQGVAAKIEAECTGWKFVLLRRERGCPLPNDPRPPIPGIAPGRGRAYSGGMDGGQRRAGA